MIIGQLWKRFLAWRSAPGTMPPTETFIKKVDIPDEEMSQFQRGLGLSEGSEGSG